MKDKLENIDTKLPVRLLSLAKLMTWIQYLSAILRESETKIVAGDTNQRMRDWEYGKRYRLSNPEVQNGWYFSSNRLRTWNI